MMNALFSFSQETPLIQGEIVLQFCEFSLVEGARNYEETIRNRNEEPKVNEIDRPKIVNL